MFTGLNYITPNRMDSSDVIKKRKNQVLYINQLNAFIARSPGGGDCAKFSTCCNGISSCLRTFDSFDLKYSFYKGRNASMSPSTIVGDFSFGVEECMYKVHGSS